MVNVQEMKDFIPVLYMLEDQGRFRMPVWAQGVVNPHAASIQECGTQFCAAGAKARIDGWLPCYEVREIWNVRRGEYAEAAVANGRFTKDPRYQDVANQSELDYEELEAVTADAWNIAREAFDLTPGQAGFLFHATHITRASDMERRFHWLMDHPQSDGLDFPHAWVAEEVEHERVDLARRPPPEWDEDHF